MLDTSQVSSLNQPLSAYPLKIFCAAIPGILSSKPSLLLADAGRCWQARSYLHHAVGHETLPRLQEVSTFTIRNGAAGAEFGDGLQAKEATDKGKKGPDGIKCSVFEPFDPRTPKLDLGDSGSFSPYL
eukprot:s3631_g9.t2